MIQSRVEMDSYICIRDVDFVSMLAEEARKARKARMQVHFICSCFRKRKHKQFVIWRIQLSLFCFINFVFTTFRF